MNTIETKSAPEAIGPYSQAIVANGFVYTSGQIPLNPKTGAIEGSGIEEQAEQAIKNLGEILKTAGTDFSKVVKTTCFLKNIADFAAFNAVYEKYFISKPARSCFEVAALPKNALVEIEAVAVLES
ncbi:MAG: RidA family protein [Treponema sp.]|uniref:RidA family protein n=1 Tax=Treponema sp. TaxID=166 RepID=UPI0025EDF51C|nr:RidA family protein [Treponema sp.]MBQ9280792.1 RidA family protein [Treponema sp.]